MIRVLYSMVVKHVTYLVRLPPEDGVKIDTKTRRGWMIEILTYSKSFKLFSIIQI
jgi:hypothetical protein